MLYKTQSRYSRPGHTQTHNGTHEGKDPGRHPRQKTHLQNHTKLCWSGAKRKLDKRRETKNTAVRP